VAADAKTLLICALRFLGGSGDRVDPNTGKRATGGGFRSFARKIARADNRTTVAELDRAERELIREGMIERRGVRSATTLYLTSEGQRASYNTCKRVELTPWDWRTTYDPSALDGRKKRRR